MLNVRSYTSVVMLLLISGCTTISSRISSLSEVKYFTFPEAEPSFNKGYDEIRLTAAVDGKLILDNQNCLRIGRIIPILHNENIVGYDHKGFFIRHKDGAIKYRLGDKVQGGGGYTQSQDRFNKYAKNGANTKLCEGEFASFYLSYPE